EAWRLGVPHPLGEEPLPVDGPTLLPVVELDRCGVTDVLDEHPLVEDDVEVVHPNLEAQIDVLAARDLVLLLPRAQIDHEVASHHVDDAGRGRRERIDDLDGVTGLRPNRARVRSGSERRYD